MRHTRRSFLGTVGAAATASVIADKLGFAEAGSAQSKSPTGSTDKALFWIAAATPCDRNLNFDPAIYKDMLAWFKSQGADGVVVLGSTGEYPSFSVAERKKVAETALKNRSGLNIIVSSGTPNAPETIELSQHAAANGADGLLIIPPFYFKDPPQDGLIKYYSMIFDQVHIPINLYHYPRMSAVPVTVELLHALEKYPNLAGIKDSSGDANGYAKFVSEFPKLNMRTGTGNNLEHALANGMGAILAEGNVFTRQVAAVFAAKRAGQDIAAPLAKLREAQALLRPAGGGFAAMKYALSLQMGTRQTFARPPFVNVTDDQMAKIKDGVQQLKQFA
jgi:4-hydroxy-tetrahydrodipicolinate synthase